MARQYQMVKQAAHNTAEFNTIACALSNLLTLGCTVSSGVPHAKLALRLCGSCLFLR